MVYAKTILESIVEVLRDDSITPGTNTNLPSDLTYRTYELDRDGDDASITLPVAELTPISINQEQSFNTEESGVVTNDAGQNIGRTYEERFDMTVQIRFISAQGGGYNPRDMARTGKTRIGIYDSRKLDRDLPDPNGNGKLSDVSQLSVGDQEPANDLSTTPALRVEQVLVDIQFEHEISSVDLVGPYDPVTQVRTPDPDSDPTAGDGDPSDIDINTS